MKTLNFLYLDFRRAVMPVMLAGSALLTGCATTRTELDLTKCNYKESTQRVIGIPDYSTGKIDESGNGAVLTINGLNIKISSEKHFSAGQACKDSAGIVRAGVVQDEKGKYNPAGLALLYTVYTRKDIDPTLKYMIAERTRYNFGFSPEEIPAISKAQWEKDNPPPPEKFVCRQDGALRRCRDEKAGSTEVTPHPQ